MALTTDDVRAQLADVIEDYISNSIIEQQLELAGIKVDAEKSSGASASFVKYAKLTQATFLSYLTYSESVRREVGTMPLALSLQLEEYKAVAEEGINFVKRRTKHHAQKGVSRLT